MQTTRTMFVSGKKEELHRLITDQKMIENLVSYARSFVHSVEDAEDVVQNASIDLWMMSEEQIQKVEILVPFIYMVVKNKAKVHFKKEKKRTTDRQTHKIAEETAEPYFERIEIEEIRKAIRKKGNPLEISVVELHCVEGYPHDVIAGINEKQPGQMRKILSNTRQWLHTKFRNGK